MSESPSEFRIGRLGLIGLGLMGAAIGQAARRRRVAGVVAGWSPSEATRRKAAGFGAVDEIHERPGPWLAGCEIAVLCCGVGQMGSVAGEVAPLLGDGAVLTDVGSVKERVVADVEAAMDRAGAKFRYVGAHPIAGSEKTGPQPEGAVVLEGAWCVITPSARSSPEAAAKVRGFWEALGMRTAEMTAGAHDRALALCSHVPHMVSAALLLLQDERSLSLAGTGLRDVTRTASGPPDMWAGIAAANSAHLARSLRRLAGLLEAMADRVERAADPAERAALQELLEEARRRRESRFPAGGIPESTTGSRNTGNPAGPGDAM
ncbi:MAG: prephenate dehydrogenase/arogenate dehydrogenase family protein [Planctomycetota bacterium]|nr:prephenate dehydrogenase/arogenate dehydrogenase family protein [Planctomycetota bacterium]